MAEQPPAYAPPNLVGSPEESDNRGVTLIRPSGDEIVRRQDEELNLRLQAAARRRYVHEALLEAGGTGLSLAFALVSIVFVLVAPSVGVVLAALAGAWLFADQLVFKPLAGRERRLGANLQQRFDSRVLGVPSKDQVAADSDLDEDVRALTASADLEKYRGWYAIPPQLRWPHSVFLAQLINAAWGARQHRAYGVTQVSVLTLLIAAETAIAIMQSMSLATFMIGLAMPSLPFLLQAAEGARAHLRVATERRALANSIRTHTINNAHVGYEEAAAFQERLFNIRARQVHVPGWFYGLVRNSFEKDTSFSAEIYASEVSTTNAD